MNSLEEIEQTICDLKSGSITIDPIDVDGEVFQMTALSENHSGNADIVECCMRWRGQHQSAFLEEFQLSLEGTQRWFDARVVNDPQRILFGVFNSHGEFVAHIGWATFETSSGSCEIDNVMRGDRPATKGIMTAATHHLTELAYNLFNCDAVRLRVFGDNSRAIRLYESVGFRRIDAIPLSLELREIGLRWHEQPAFDPLTTSRLFVKMEHRKAAGK